MKSLPCPKCGREFSESVAKPFCSTRCELADLGNWLNEEYKITRELTEEDLEKFGVLNPYDENAF